MFKTRTSFSMNPVDPVQALHDPLSALTCPPQREQAAGPANNEHRIRLDGKIMGQVHIARTQPLFKFQTKRSRAADSINTRNDANT